MSAGETIWLGRSNTLARRLEIDGGPLDLSAVTRLELSMREDRPSGGHRIFRSDELPTLFKWDGAPGVVSISLGSQELTPGRYSAVLSVFSPSYQDGLAFPQFYIEVVKP